jgi:hypothetical protein
MAHALVTVCSHGSPLCSQVQGPPPVKSLTALHGRWRQRHQLPRICRPGFLVVIALRDFVAARSQAARVTTGQQTAASPAPAVQLAAQRGGARQLLPACSALACLSGMTKQQ